MSNYRKTMTEALQEMVSLDERMRMPRQLIDTNKEVMIVKKNKVIVIDKKDQDKYMKQGWELAEEVGLNEGTIDKVKEIASKKSAAKIGGVMVDSFTASAISQIYDKVNDANKKKMEKLPITKLANLAFKMMQKNEFVPEEVDLDEVDRSTYSDRIKRFTGFLKDAEKEKPLDKEWIKLLKRRIEKENADLRKELKRSPRATTRKELGMSEDVDLDEGKMQDMWQKKNAQSLSVGPFELLRGKSGVHTIKRSGKVLGDFSYDSDADNFVANMKGMRGQWTGNDIDSLFTHLQKVHKEEVELDENKLKDLVIKGQDLEAYAKKSGGIDKKDMMNVAAMLKKGDKSGALKYAKKLDTDPKEYILNLMGEEVELDEKKTITLVKNKQPTAYDRMRRRMNPQDRKTVDASDKKQIKDLESRGWHRSPYDEEVEVEEGAAADARRAMRRDPEMRQRAFSKDNSATDDDVKGASKNIMMQMRKAQSLNGRFDVEFADGKKVKIPAKMAIAVQSKYNKMRRPAEKEKFQAKIAKSYRDMLSALKEAVSPAQQAAIAISKKERGEKPKKESVLDRIDKKIKEKNDG